MENTPGQTYLVDNLGDIERGDIAGYNKKKVGVYTQLFPRLSRDHYDMMKQVAQPEVFGVMEEKVRIFNYLADKDRRHFVESRKIVENEEDGSLSIVPRIPLGSRAIDLSRVEKLDSEDIDLSGRERKVYTLVAVFNDASVAAKFSITERQLETAGRLAVGNPNAAAKFLQDLMNLSQDSIAVTVRAADLVKSKAQAKLTVKILGRGCPFSSASILSTVCGSQIFLFGPDGEDGWHVRGPCCNFDEVRMVYDLVAYGGCVDVNFLLGMELVLLGIDIYDGSTYEMPRVKHHVATSDISALQMTRAGSTLNETLGFSEMKDRLLPVIVDDIGQVATAVRVTDRHILVNAHVLETGPITIGAVSPVMHRQIGRDLWSCVLPGQSESWRMREPVVGETVCVVFSVGGRVCTSSVTRLVSFTDSILTMVKVADVIEGTSGGAIVAVSDMALLGVHSAETNVNLLGARFGANHFAEIIDGDEVSAVSRTSDDGSFGADALLTLKKKGLGHVVRAAIGSLVPVSVAMKHVGMAVNVGGELYTTCDGEMPLRMGEERRVGVFESTGVRGMFKTQCMFPSLTTPYYSRAPRYFEKVFVVGYDMEDAFLTSETVVSHIGLNSANFIIRDIPNLDKPVSGGIVMAWDGAVIGICGEFSMSTAVGAGYQCKAFPTVKVKPLNEPSLVLREKFPFLNVDTWDASLIEEVFVHSSTTAYKDTRRLFNAGNKPLANLGDNIAKYHLYSQLRELGLPHSQWSNIMQSLQTNDVFAAKAWEFGFAQCVAVGPGVSLPRGAKAYADATEALIGAASIVEKPDVVYQLCKSLGILFGEERRDSFDELKGS